MRQACNGNVAETRTEGLDMSEDEDEIANTIRDIHRTVAEWKKHSRFDASVNIPKTGLDSYARLIRSANAALSRYTLCAEVVYNRNGSPYIRITIKDTKGVHES